MIASARGHSVIMQSSDLKGFRFNLNTRRPIASLLTAASLMAMTLMTCIAHAQFRTIPPDAKRATVGQQQYPLPYIDLGGTAVRLAPGGVIYDQNNRSIVHGALPPGSDVAVVRDMNGDIGRMYILTPHEQANFRGK